MRLRITALMIVIMAIAFSFEPWISYTLIRDRGGIVLLNITGIDLYNADKLGFIQHGTAGFTVFALYPLALFAMFLAVVIGSPRLLLLSSIIALGIQLYFYATIPPKIDAYIRAAGMTPFFNSSGVTRYFFGTVAATIAAVLLSIFELKVRNR